MTFYQQLALICVASACNIFLSMWLFWWRKKAAIPEDFAVFKERMERMLAERKSDNDDVAGAVLRLQGDMVGVRETVQWIKGRINGTHWKQP